VLGRTDCSGGNSLDVYSGGAPFEYRMRQQMSWLRFMLLFWVPPDNPRDRTGTGLRPLPSSSFPTNHSWYHLTLHNLHTEKRSLNNSRKEKKSRSLLFYVKRANIFKYLQESILLLFTASRPNLGPTRSPRKLAPGALSPGVNQRGVKLTTHLHLVPRLRKVELQFHSPISLYGVVLI
jgi:hypothetical protein